MFGEFVELHLERSGPFELDVLLVSHFNQESFHSGETLRDWLHDGGDNGWNDGGHERRNRSTMVGLRSFHLLALYPQMWAVGCSV
jgi:hypothetical protein